MPFGFACYGALYLLLWRSNRAKEANKARRELSASASPPKPSVTWTPDPPKNFSRKAGLLIVGTIIFTAIYLFTFPPRGDWHFMRLLAYVLLIIVGFAVAVSMAIEFVTPDFGGKASEDE